jgi:hypothetical protein
LLLCALLLLLVVLGGFLIPIGMIAALTLFVCNNSTVAFIRGLEAPDAVFGG